MSLLNTSILLLLLSGVCQALDVWSWANHGKPPVYSGMAAMKSGWSTKLFGVGNGRLQERYWSGSSWVWADHGHPWGLWSGESLGSTPCVMYDGKLFIVSNKGRLFERYWSTSSSSWVWAIHGKAFGSVSLRTSGCACTTWGSVGRVFAVGTSDRRLYERYWSSSSSGWVWRDHGKPPGTDVGPAAIDTCNLNTCSTRVYLIGGNGNLYYRDVGSLTWINKGRPSGEFLNSVSVHSAGVFVSTRRNDVCQLVSGTWYNYGKPPGISSYPKRATTISKAYRVDQCAHISDTPNPTRVLFVYSWDSTYAKRSRLFALKIKYTNIISWTDHGTIGNCCHYVDAPELFLSGTCPKAFFTRSNGYVHELYVH